MNELVDFGSFGDEDMREKEEKSSTLTRKEVLELLAETKDLRNLDMRKANLVKVDFSGCDLRGSNFSYANLKEAVFRGADMRDSSLWNANLEGADFTDADLEGADLDYSKLRGAILYKANLRRATLPTELVPREDIVRSVKTGCKVGHTPH
jgi:uncharacterized protein YjbI with pentapeptide repeats